MEPIFCLLGTPEPDSTPMAFLTSRGVGGVNFTYQNAEILDNWIKETNSNINESVAAKQLTELKQSLVYKDFIAGKNTLGAHVLEDEFYTPLAEAITEGIEKEHTNRGFYIQYPTYTDINGTITVGSESIDTIGFNLGALLWSF